MLDESENVSSGFVHKNTDGNKDIFREGRSCSAEWSAHSEEVEIASVDYWFKKFVCEQRKRDDMIE
jgi:hypothetical protein